MQFKNTVSLSNPVSDISVDLSLIWKHLKASVKIWVPASWSVYCFIGVRDRGDNYVKSPHSNHSFRLYRIFAWMLS